MINGRCRIRSGCQPCGRCCHLIICINSGLSLCGSFKQFNHPILPSGWRIRSSSKGFVNIEMVNLGFCNHFTNSIDNLSFKFSTDLDIIRGYGPDQICPIHFNSSGRIGHAVIIPRTLDHQCCKSAWELRDDIRQIKHNLCTVVFCLISNFLDLSIGLDINHVPVTPPLCY